MPRKPKDYITLFNERIKQSNIPIFLVNTGWVKGPYGIGERVDISISKTIIKAILSNQLDNAKTLYDKRFKLDIVIECNGVNNDLLVPWMLWDDQNKYAKRAEQLSAEFKNIELPE